ncbi:UDP-N-acetylenolpyruvoylglucosamine reductase [Marinobacterium zhoushanense]|uniref:UDP-N-acetylenolpyruvoylglucosamine reductase n=1 Tax=Marinobacterium zhoushanense TaxID=1679163 RepID=A0ABQ1KLM7_9GAMM|nr:UDP-N-acetylmuramate dehydrogenase [Marinobacterium zhoushanense]GGC03011.1 UDP-N-acetylenolpyruvoylglucosamine reductase [Marinobacterium zhoushanense]
MSLLFFSDHPLRGLNTFGFEAYAQCFTRIESKDDVISLHQYLDEHRVPLLLIGGGSNLVLGPKVPGIVAQVLIAEMALEELAADRVRVTLGAGEAWHASIERLLDQGIYGLENLALIPGCVGAAPVQNIGAYGVEVKDRIEAVEVYDWQQRRFYWLDNAECRFAYRDSIFKHHADRYLITRVRFLLSRLPNCVLSYKPLREAIEPGREHNPRAIFNAVCRIRRAKLPDPDLLGNAGSFFKNPIVSAAQYEALKQKYPDMVAYPEGSAFKLAAGWLIDRRGWKGYRRDGVGVHEHQALVLVNHGDGCRQQIETLAQQIRNDVMEQFGVQLEVEPRFYP